MINKDIDQQEILRQLLEEKKITTKQVEEINKIFSETGRDIVDIIRDGKYLNEEEFTKVEAEVTGMQYVDLADIQIKKNVLEIIPQEIAQNYHVIPFEKNNNELSVAVVTPNDYKAVEALDFLARKDNYAIKYFLASKTNVENSLRNYENFSSEVKEALEDSQEKEDILSEEKDKNKDGNVEEVYKTAPISKMVSVIIRHAVEGEASDVHIEPVGGQTRVRFRMDGILHTSIVLPNNVHNAIVSRIKVMANLKLDETRIPQDGRFRMDVDGRKIDFRVSTLPLVEYEKVTIRILDNQAARHTLEDLGFFGRNLELINRYVKSAHGMLLVTGPTGSGKTTTLYSALSLLNNEFVNIITLEDPIEYYLKGISQSQINQKAGLTFANGLRSILRQDPDIIMVGEIRDNETAELAIHASLTGHKVLSTLHTNNAIGTITRLVDMDIEPFLISSALKMAVAQRLVRKVCDKCKKEISFDESIRDEVVMELSKVPSKYLPKGVDLNNLKAFRGEGCSHCENSGYHGRVAIAEVLEITSGVEKLISNSKFSDKELVEQELIQQGMYSMKIDGFMQALRGMTTFEEVISATKD